MELVAVILDRAALEDWLHILVYWELLRIAMPGVFPKILI